MSANPFPPITCECGEVWTQEMYTVCPKCVRWSRRESDPNTPLRMHIALTFLRAWHTPDQFDSSLVLCIYDWIDGGMNSPIPWPSSPFVAQWAERRGYSNIGGFIGFRLTVEVIRRAEDQA